jgi:tRNA 2-thiouridine synthesizing protein E
MTLRIDSTRTDRPAPAVGGFDADGFLVDPDEWTAPLAEYIALLEGLDGLSARHWQVIGIVRDRFHAVGGPPVMRLICRAAGVDPSSAHDLFSSCRSLWRIAGLPNPGAEAMSYMN